MDFGRVWLLIEAGSGAVWLAGLVAAWRGNPAWSFGAALVAAVTGLLTILAVFALPRGFFGAIGAGDGFGLIGLMVYSAAAMGIAIVAAGLTAALVSFRQSHQRRAGALR